MKKLPLFRYLINLLTPCRDDRQKTPLSSTDVNRGSITSLRNYRRSMIAGLLLILIATVLIQRPERHLFNNERNTTTDPQPQIGSSISFEINRGQADGQVKFLSRGNGYGLFLTSTETVFAMSKPQALRSDRKTKGILSAERRTRPVLAPPTVFKMEVVGAKQDADVSGFEPLESRSNYFIGNDPQQWHTDIPHFAKVKYEGIYPGINLVYYSNRRQLEYDFIVAPGADPNQIKLAFKGAEQVRIDSNGELVLDTEAGELRQHKPLVYQEINGSRQQISGNYVMTGDRQVGFELGEYDRTKDLVIDPVLIYSTYLGGFDYDVGNGVEIDAAENTYLTGFTYSNDFPTLNQLQFNMRGLGNAFISKYTSAGRLVYSTFFGGASEDVGFAITSDAAGNIYLTGSTNSGNFPTTDTAYQRLIRGQIDVFVAKVNPTGNALLYSTLLGGQFDDIGNAIAIDNAGNAYVTGETASPDFPTQTALQNTLRGTADAFIVKLNSDGSGASYSTYLGGNGRETGFGITVDGAGSAHVTGFVYSNDFPTKNPVQAALAGRVDAFITKLTPEGTELAFSTYFGGSDDDGGFGIGLDGSGKMYVTGFTTSTDFPTKTPFQAASAGGDDAFIASFSAAGALNYSSYLGGSSEERAFDLAVTPSGDVYVAGRTESADFPVKNAFQPTMGGVPTSLAPAKTQSSGQGRIDLKGRSQIMDVYGRDSVALRSPVEGKTTTALTARTEATAVVAVDGFVTKVGPTGQVVYSSFIGGDGEDRVFGVAADTDGHAFLTGYTTSTNFPIKDAQQPTFKGFADVFVTKIADQATTHTSVSAASYVGQTLSPEQIVAAFGSGLATKTEYAQSIPLPTKLGDITINVKDSAGVEQSSQLFAISPTQINYLLPAGTAFGNAQVLIHNNGVLVSTEDIKVSAVAPGIFTGNMTGQDVVAAVVLRVKADGTQVYEPAIEFDATQNKFVAVPINLGGPSSTDKVFLVVFGTGVRFRSALSAVIANVGGGSAPVFFAGPQGVFSGVDQVNLLLPTSLTGRGEVGLFLVVDGKTSNTVKLNIQ